MRPRRLRSEEVMFLRMFRADAAREQRGRCAYCGGPMAPGEITADHITPRKRGGTTKRENIAACCAPCNRAKGSMTTKAFMKAIQSPPPKARLSIHLAHFRYRLWRRTWEACARIERLAGL
jgi:Restriction endonuclease